MGHSASPSVGHYAALSFVARGRAFKSQAKLAPTEYCEADIICCPLQACPELVEGLPPVCCSKKGPTITLPLSSTGHGAPAGGGFFC
jgi:hypothetical protein